MSKNPGGRYGYRKAFRREGAEQRAQLRANRSDEDQLKRLDDLFGLGQGSQKERARLHARINSGNRAPKAAKKSKRK